MSVAMKGPLNAIPKSLGNVGMSGTPLSASKVWPIYGMMYLWNDTSVDWIGL